nr:hypothetical protein [Tanacetum cinerariifolium]
DESSLVIQNKARLVAVGYSQQEGIHYDETFAPEEVYVGQPPGFVSKQYPDHVYALDKALPDIMFATCMCARYQANPNEHHVSAVKRIFRYLKGTINLGLWYPKDSGFDLTAYPNADHAGSESEYVAISSCCAQALWMRTQLTDYGFFYDKVSIYYDSKSAIAISYNPIQHTWTKHIDVRFRTRLLKIQVAQKKVKIAFENADLSSRVELIPSKIKYANKVVLNFHKEFSVFSSFSRKENDGLLQDQVFKNKEEVIIKSYLIRIVPSNTLQSDEDSMKLNELMELWNFVTNSREMPSWREIVSLTVLVKLASFT